MDLKEGWSLTADEAEFTKLKMTTHFKCLRYYMVLSLWGINNLEKPEYCWLFIKYPDGYVIFGEWEIEKMGVQVKNSYFLSLGKR